VGLTKRYIGFSSYLPGCLNHVTDRTDWVGDVARDDAADLAT